MTFAKSLKFKTTQNEFLKIGGIGVLVLYAVTLTVMCFKLTPKTLIIAIEPTGTRVVSSDTDRALRLEKESFLRRFVTLLYAFDSTSFDQRVSSAGDLMAAELWKQKQDEFSKLSGKMKTDELSQSVKLLDLREVDSENYQVDIELKVNHKLQETPVKLRVDIKIRKRKQRTEENAYDMEVVNYVETNI